MERLSLRDLRKVVKAHFEASLGLSLEDSVLVELPDDRSCRFDLATADGSVLITVKTAPVTSLKKESDTRLNRAKHDALLLGQSNATRKLIVFDDPTMPGQESLAGRLHHRNFIWLGDVEVWRHTEGSFSKVE